MLWYLFDVLKTYWCHGNKVSNKLSKILETKLLSHNFYSLCKTVIKHFINTIYIRNLLTAKIDEPKDLVCKPKILMRRINLKKLLTQKMSTQKILLKQQNQRNKYPTLMKHFSKIWI